jgi:hypothetical protein
MQIEAVNRCLGMGSNMKRKNRLEVLWSKQPTQWKEAYRANLPDKFTVGDGTAAVESALNWADNYYAKAKATGNPLNVWFAYQEFQSAGLPLPSWILAYFDHAAAELRKGIYSKPKEATRFITAALVMGGRGRGTAFSTFQDIRELFAYATWAQEANRPHFAHGKIAKALRVTKRSAQRLVERGLSEDSKRSK